LGPYFAQNFASKFGQGLEWISHTACWRHGLSVL